MWTHFIVGELNMSNILVSKNKVLQDFSCCGKVGKSLFA